MTTDEPGIVHRIRAAAAADAAFLPVHARFGVRAVSAEVGRVEVAQRMGPYCLDRHGRLSPGSFLVGSDTALGSSIASRLPDDRSVVSLTIHLRLLEMDAGASREFRLIAKAAHLTGSAASATGRIIDDTGRLVALLSTHCAVVPSDRPLPVGTSYPLDDCLVPEQRPDSEFSPLATTCADARSFSVEDGAVGLAATATPELGNSRGVLQGGVLGLLAEQAVSASLIRATPALAAADSMDLHVSYLRPVRPDHPHLRIVARPEHASRRFAVAHGVGHDDSGRAVVSVSGSRYRG